MNALSFAKRIDVISEYRFKPVTRDDKVLGYKHPSGWKIRLEKLRDMDDTHFFNWCRKFEREVPDWADTTPWITWSVATPNDEAALAHLVSMAKEVTHVGAKR